MPNLIYPAEDESTASCHLKSKALKIVQEGFFTAAGMAV